MNCSHWQQQILNAIDQPAARPVGLEEHVAGCEACREFREAQQSLDRALATLLAPPPLPPHFRARLRRRLRRGFRASWIELVPDLLNLLGAGSLAALASVYFSAPHAALFATLLGSLWIVARSQVEELED